MTGQPDAPYKILIVDDDRVIRKVLEAALTNEGYQVVIAVDGSEGLQLARKHHPDLVVTDKMMPNMNGFELIRRLRRDPDFIHLPILILTSQSELEDKLGAFEAGADDYLPKPFEAAELIVRLAALLRRSNALKMAQAGKLEQNDPVRIIAVHTLRGGIGCSSIAVNTALAIRGLWQKPTLLLDMVFTVGQVALMLNRAPKRTWGDLGAYSSKELDVDVVKSIVGQHDSGLEFILGSSNPTTAEQLDSEVVSLAVSYLRPHFEYMVVDLPHRFDETTLNILDYADEILMVISPELASIRAAAITLDTYRKLGYTEEKIKLVLNCTFEEGGLSSKKIIDVLKYPITLTIPFAPKQFVTAINRGVPLLVSSPTDPISTLIEDFAFRISKAAHQMQKPKQPSEAWLRVQERTRSSSKSKDRTRWPF